MGIIGESHGDGGGGVLQLRTEIAKIRCPEQGSLHIILRARGYDHGADPGIVETVSHAHHAGAWFLGHHRWGRCWGRWRNCGFALRRSRGGAPLEKPYHKQGVTL